MPAKPQTKQLIEVVSKMQKLKLMAHSSRGVAQGELFLLCQINDAINHQSDPLLPGIKISTLSAQAGMSMPAVSQMLNSLEDKGLIERNMAKIDRRVVYVTLTEKGNQLRVDTFRHMTDILDRIVEKFGEGNTETLVELFNRLYGIMKDMEQSMKNDGE